MVDLSKNTNEFFSQGRPRLSNRRTRLDHEMRDQLMLFRVTRQEQNDFYQWARSQKMSMSYFIRAALESSYPSIFKNANRHIRKPRKPKPMPIPSAIKTSLVNQQVTIEPAFGNQQVFPTPSLTQPHQG